jgi:Ion channel
MRTRIAAYLESLIALQAGTLFYIWFVGNVFFASIYTFLAYLPNEGPNLDTSSLAHTFLEAIYFTFVTTFTIGYGDISPHGMSRVVMFFHSLGALVLTVAFTTKIITWRQDKNVELMREMVDAHTMRSVREELHQFRRDLERVESNLRAQLGVLGEYDWELLGSAALHSVVITHQIEALLTEKNSSTAVHEMYEVMVLESLYRSIKRLHRFLSLLPSTQRSMPEYEYAFFNESRTFVKKTQEVIALWKTVSAAHTKADFDEHILELCTVIDQRIAWALQLTGAQQAA